MDGEMEGGNEDAGSEGDEIFGNPGEDVGYLPADHVRRIYDDQWTVS